MEAHWPARDTSRIQVSVHSRLEQVPAGVWSPGEQPGALYCSARWFTLAETLGTELRYLVAREVESGSALAVLPVLLDPARPGGSYDLVSLLLAPALGSEAGPARWQRSLVGGSWNSNLALLPAMHIQPVEVRQAVLSALLSACEHIALQTGSQGISLPFLLPETAQELAGLVGERGFFVRTAPTTWIQLQAHTFAELLGSFSRKTRKNIWRELRTFQGGDGQVQIEPLGTVVDEVANLVVQQQLRHTGTGERASVRRILAAQVQVFGEQALVFCTRRQGQITAAVNLLVSHGGLYARSFGRCDGGAPSMEYFTLGYYEPFRYGIEHGLRWYHAGPQAYEAKVRRALELVPLWTLFLPLHPPTAAHQGAVQRWNDAVFDHWQRWFISTLGNPLPPSWRALNAEK